MLMTPYIPLKSFWHYWSSKYEYILNVQNVGKEKERKPRKVRDIESEYPKRP
jgi:hypothetical protein